MSRPNFVFIMTDTQGANVVGCYGRPEMRTPRIDGLAAEGVRFERAYSTFPVCTPGRSALFTGVYPSFNGAWANELPLGANVRTMGERFRDLGYATAYTGKWHLDGHDYFGTGECPEGWDPAMWYDGKRYLDDLSDDEIQLWRRGLGSVEALKEHGIGPEFTWGRRVSDKAIDWIEKRAAGDDPFLLVVSYDEPHGPCTCPAEYVEPFVEHDYDLGPGAFDDLADKPAHHRAWAAACGKTQTEGKVRKAMYFGCQSFVDNEIGRVIGAVDRFARDDTVVIFTSDHGTMMGAHGITNKGPVMYEEITRIPLVVRMPGGEGPGRVDGTLASHVDLLPTMLELAGEGVPDLLSGESLAPVLRGDETDADRSVVIEFERFDVDNDAVGEFLPIRCIVRGDYKLAVNLLDSVDELYNLADDPAEVVNLIDDASHAEARDRLHDELLEWMDRTSDPFRGPCWANRPWRSIEFRDGFRGGKFRPRKPDGYAPPYRMYSTAQPATAYEAEHS